MGCYQHSEFWKFSCQTRGCWTCCCWSKDGKTSCWFPKKQKAVYVTNSSEGNGKKAEKGKTVSVHYSGQLEDGKVFDSSYARKKPIEFPLGMVKIVKGWDEGIELLQVGDKARFVIPSHLGYGSREEQEEWFHQMRLWFLM